MLEKLIEIDTQLFLFLNGIHSPFWDTIMWYTSATATWVPLYALVLFFIFKEYKWKGFVPLIFLVLLVFAADKISVHAFKNFFERLRPCHNQDIANLVHIIREHCGGQYGFVSSHAANTFAFASFTSLFFRNKKYTWFIFIWAAFVSYSRIYLGVHYPGDIMGGALLGWIIGYLLYQLYIPASKYFRVS
ncbi:MAG: phosphatase PAP2 family protein [Bacteroidales bacterium]|nr:phosphatase PAP2 family protein [Bacteroidales bacterium]